MRQLRSVEKEGVYLSGHSLILGTCNLYCVVYFLDIWGIQLRLAFFLLNSANLAILGLSLGFEERGNIYSCIL